MSEQILTDYLHSTGRRCTPERFMVLAGVEAMKGHFSAEELLARMQDEGKVISRGTVYTNLKLLQDCGLVQSVLMESGLRRYQWTGTPHHHLMCCQCGKIKDVKDPELDEILRSRRYSAFTPTSFSVSVSGICSACARKARKSKSNKKE